MLNQAFTSLTSSDDVAIFGSVSLLILLLLFLLGRPLQKQPRGPSFQIGPGWNLAKWFFK